MRGLYVITQETETSANRIFRKTSEAILGGASFVQFRQKSSDVNLLMDLSQAVFEACKNHGAQFFINDRIDLAKILQSDGVHLGQSDESVQNARHILGRSACIGQTCHNSLILMNRAVKEGADYCAFGSIFKSSTKPNAQKLTIEELKVIGRTCSVPIVAIGGITIDNATQVIDAGADVLAISNAVFGAKDIAEAAHQLTQLF